MASENKNQDINSCAFCEAFGAQGKCDSCGKPICKDCEHLFQVWLNEQDTAPIVKHLCSKCYQEEKKKEANDNKFWVIVAVLAIVILGIVAIISSNT